MTSLFDSRPGLSIIVVTYRRIEALCENLESLLRQDLRDFPSEIIVVNNDPDTIFRPSRWSKPGRLFRDNPQIRVINARNDWLFLIRWGMMYLADYDTVLMLDDDFSFRDAYMARDMYETLMGLDRYDIVSCWATIWTRWTEEACYCVRLSIHNPVLTELIATDVCGSGITMFNKEMLLDVRAQRFIFNREIKPTTDMGLGLLTNLLWNGTAYFMPSYERVKEHPQSEKNPQHLRPGAKSRRTRMYKLMLRQGYKPLITRGHLAEDSPEMKFIRSADERIDPWSDSPVSD